MDPSMAIALGRQVFVIAITIALPVLGLGLLVGLAVALFQAVTSLQEQTLSMVPKMLAVAGTIFVLLPWILGQLTDFALRLIGGLAHYGGVT